MSYCTRYSIFNKTTKQEVFKNSNTSCFAQFTSSSTIIGCEFLPDRYMEIYVQKNNDCAYIPSNIEELQDLIEWWVDELNKADIPVDFEVRKMSRIIDETDNLNNLPLDNYYIFTLDFAKYLNKAHVKIACYLLRHIWEYKQWKIIEASKEYQKNNPKASGFEIFQFMFMFVFGSGHTLLNHKCEIFALNKKEFKELASSWKVYTNNELDDFKQYCHTRKIIKNSYYYDNVLIPLSNSNYNFHIDMKWEDYQKIVNKKREEINGTKK